MSEIQILALYGLLVIATLILQATGTMTQLGLGYLLGSRDESRSISGITARLERALNNSITAMVLFAPAVLLLVVSENTSNQSILAAQAFLIARIIYVPAYAFGVVGVRSLAWTIGIFATIALYLLAL
ncbi:hypothetical protein ROLI_007760 [Roseobacter fucihabitans]|uniref:Inner membrane protein n=1 Tax=Roseobacter fucihabitans TaxID=1537242 RepID=A0ABZ2BNW9_9RHOB|nr:MAPEG family protein [Roseobacter litoralis]MBC6966056.1 MAPEG family protein [Roseobacter litoralis]